MPSDEYGNAVGGGLKLKGSKPSGITKKKKKKDKSHVKDAIPALEDALSGSENAVTKTTSKSKSEGVGERVHIEEEDELDGGSGHGDGKTEAERKYEEMRRKRLDERLKKEGVKTHKQRVEELNKYLSNLSEHHDMPRIGPG